LSRKNSGFSKTDRLVKAADYQRVFDFPQRFYDGCFAVLARENNSDTARLGLALSKKHLQTAVRRNHIKRLVRESFRKNKQSLRGRDIVVLSRKQVSGKSDDLLRHSLASHWKKIGRCKKSSQA